MYRSLRVYNSTLRAAVMDWSGTTVDPYSLAPPAALQELFKREGVPINIDEAREPMGSRKDRHVGAILEMPRVIDEWKNRFGRPPNKGDLYRLYEAFVPLQLTQLPRYADLVPGLNEAISILRNEFSLKIGITTGYTSAMSKVLKPLASEKGFVPDTVVSGDDVMSGMRPRPYMLFRTMELMDVWPVSSVVKVDDTRSGIEEGLAAGCWSIGVARYSNYMGIESKEHALRLSETEVSDRLAKAKELLTSTGAHYVIDELRHLPEICLKINERLKLGEKP